MTNTFFTSDTHFGHDKDFLFGPRGFDNWFEHGEAIVERWNSVVKPDDEVWHLGDVMLSKHNEEQALKWVNSLNGKIHLIIGNHDSDSRLDIYKKECPNIVSYDFAQRMKADGITFFLSHFPMYTINDGHKEDKLYSSVISLHGHTHQKETFIEGVNNIYHVGLDSHRLTPVHMDEIISELKHNYKQ